MTVGATTLILAASAARAGCSDLSLSGSSGLPGCAASKEALAANDGGAGGGGVFATTGRARTAAGGRLRNCDRRGGTRRHGARSEYAGARRRDGGDRRHRLAREHGGRHRDGVSRHRLGAAESAVGTAVTAPGSSRLR